MTQRNDSPIIRKEDREALPPVVRDLVEKMLNPGTPFFQRENYAATVRRISEVTTHDLRMFEFERAKAVVKKAD